MRSVCTSVDKATERVLGERRTTPELKGRNKREIPEKTRFDQRRRPGTIPTCGISGATPLEIKPLRPAREASVLTAAQNRGPIEKSTKQGGKESEGYPAVPARRSVIFKSINTSCSPPRAQTAYLPPSRRLPEQVPRRLSADECSSNCGWRQTGAWTVVAPTRHEVPRKRLCARTGGKGNRTGVKMNVRGRRDTRNTNLAGRERGEGEGRKRGKRLLKRSATATSRTPAGWPEERLEGDMSVDAYPVAEDCSEEEEEGAPHSRGAFSIDSILGVRPRSPEGCFVRPTPVSAVRPATLYPVAASQSAELFRTFEAEKCGSNKGGTATRMKCAFATKRKSLIWPAVFSSLQCVTFS
ncbi:hypothetical protein PR048_032596 [Dryococelus australis]|uniref:Uncharacterized protein n=1 Tax=Dryococelus australis TaxID=614101 RepID=A0ABQ9G2N4_9NEOP|nr:hypothetical protein PR048_032596 [Dryococelus australis]